MVFAHSVSVTVRCRIVSAISSPASLNEIRDYCTSWLDILVNKLAAACRSIDMNASQHSLYLYLCLSWALADRPHWKKLIQWKFPDMLRKWDNYKRKILFKVPSGCDIALKTKTTFCYSFNSIDKFMLNWNFHPALEIKKNQARQTNKQHFFFHRTKIFIQVIIINTQIWPSQAKITQEFCLIIATILLSFFFVTIRLKNSINLAVAFRSQLLRTEDVLILASINAKIAEQKGVKRNLTHASGGSKMKHHSSSRLLRDII